MGPAFCVPACGALGIPNDALRMGVLRAHRFQSDSGWNTAGKLSRVRPLMWADAVAFLVVFVAS